ncbi:hypothetical protein GFB76_18220 [Acinetobacter baumannii]|nr:hypothetical protein [Acinetobacter baumannii]
MPAFEWVHVQLHQQKGMISLSPPTICNSATNDELKQLAINSFEASFISDEEKQKWISEIQKI